MWPTGEPSALKGACSVRGRAGGKGPSHRYLACCLSYYNLDEPLPDHSSLTRIRERYGVELFRGFFEAIVDQCQQAGLVWGKELYVDATKVNANASMESVKPRFAVEAHLANLFAAEPGGPAEEAQQLATQDEPTSSEVRRRSMQLRWRYPPALSRGTGSNHPTEPRAP